MTNFKTVFYTLGILQIILGLSMLLYFFKDSKLIIVPLSNMYALLLNNIGSLNLKLLLVKFNPTLLALIEVSLYAKTLLIKLSKLEKNLFLVCLQRPFFLTKQLCVQFIRRENGRKNYQTEISARNEN